MPTICYYTPTVNPGCTTLNITDSGIYKIVVKWGIIYDAGTSTYSFVLASGAKLYWGNKNCDFIGSEGAPSGTGSISISTTTSFNPLDCYKGFTNLLQYVNPTKIDVYDTISGVVKSINPNTDILGIMPSATKCYIIMNFLAIFDIDTESYSCGVQYDSTSLNVQSCDIICYHGETNILTKNIMSDNIELCLAKDISSLQHHVYSITRKQFVPVRMNIVTHGANKFIKFKKDSFGENKPSSDFYVTPGHPIVINNEEIPAGKIPEGEQVLLDNQDVFSICTDRRELILVNNLPVVTWSYYAWMNLVANHGKSGWTDNKIQHHKCPTLEIKLLDILDDTQNVKIEKDAFGLNNPDCTLFVNEFQQVNVNDDIVPITALMDGRWVKFLL